MQQRSTRAIKSFLPAGILEWHFGSLANQKRSHHKKPAGLTLDIRQLCAFSFFIKKKS